MLRIAVIVGSTRSRRQGARIGRWVVERGRVLLDQDVTLELIDLADEGLPLLDEPLPPSLGRYTHEYTKAWGAKIASYDGFVFVAGEHNHSFPASLKNAIDHLFAEWNDKAAGIVSYGGQGGVRAAEQLRLVLAEVKVATVRTSPALTLRVDVPIDDDPEVDPVRPGPMPERFLTVMFEELQAWTAALRMVRSGALV